MPRSNGTKSNAVSPVATAVASGLTAQQFAEAHHVSTKTVRRAISRGELRAYRLGGTRLLRIHPDDVDGWLRPLPTAGAHGGAA